MSKNKQKETKQKKGSKKSEESGRESDVCFPDLNETPEKLQKTLVAMARHYQGPIPDPESLAKYNEIISGGAERIMVMAENQSAHRIKMESMLAFGELRQSKRGQIFGFILAIIMLGLSTLFAFQGWLTLAAITMGTTIIGLVTIFVVGKKSVDQD